MGTTSSSAPKSRKAIESKLRMSDKTGVLNLKDLDLKASSSVWGKISNLGLTAKLKTLDISGNTLKTLPPEIYEMDNLRILHFSRCNVQYTHNMTNLVRLQTVDMDNNDLESEVLAALPASLTKLNLCNNHLVSIPVVCFADLTNLKELNLSGNRLSSSDGIGVLLALVNLNLDDNKLEELSVDIAMCTMLQHISLRNNKMSARSVTREGEQSIPSVVFTDTQLSSIDLSGNRMISKSIVLDFEGIGTFIERRKRKLDKNLAGGAVLDSSLFGTLE